MATDRRDTMRPTYRIRLPDRTITTDSRQIAQQHKQSPWARVERTGEHA